MLVMVDLVVVDHIVDLLVLVMLNLVPLLQQQIQTPHQMVLVVMVVLVELHKVLEVVEVLVVLVQHLLLMIKKVVQVELVFSCHPHLEILFQLLDFLVLVQHFTLLVVEEEVAQVHLIM